MSLKLYYDLMSQPSRALYILFKTLNCPFEAKAIDLRKGVHYSDEFSAINRFQKVPVIDHNGFVLFESVAILRYLVDAGVIPDTFYPKDNQARARVDEYLEWHQIGLRLHSSMYFRVKYMNPVLAKVEPDWRKVAEYEKRMEAALQELETKWLGRGFPFLTGQNVTFADLQGVCEVEQPRMAGYDASEHYPNIAAWMRRVKGYFDPHYSEAHVILNKVVKKYASTLNQSQSKL